MRPDCALRFSRGLGAAVRRLASLGLVVLPLACGDAATDPSELVVRTAMVEEVFVDVVSVAPTRVEIIVVGNFRDTCSQIGDVTQSRTADQFEVRIMTARPMDAVCSQVLVSFEETIVLMNTENVASGDYLVDVNGVTEPFTIGGTGPVETFWSQHTT